MILKSSERSWATKLAIHLTNTDDNERVVVRSSRNIITGEDVFGALKDMEVIARNTPCEKHMHHIMMNPGGSLTDDEWDRCWALYEEEFGLGEQPYIEVEHLKEGRVHRHRVYHRIRRDAPAITFDFSWKRNEYLGRIMEHDLGHELTIGKHNHEVIYRLREDGLDPVADWMEAGRAHEAERPVAEKNHQDNQIEKRTGIDTSEIVERCTTAWAETTDGRSFRAALFGQGLLLARGDKIPFVVVDEAGIHHSLPKRLPRGINTPEVKDRLADIDPASLPTIELARAQQLDMAERHEQAIRDRQQEDDRTSSDDPAVSEAPDREPDADRSVAGDEPERGEDTAPQTAPAESEPEGLTKAAAEHVIRSAWEQSETGHALRAALGAEGLVLARREGRNDFVVVDQAGQDHALARRIGEKIRLVRERLADLSTDDLPTVAEAREQQFEFARLMRGSYDDRQIGADRDRADDDTGLPEQPDSQADPVDSRAPEQEPDPDRSVAGDEPEREEDTGQKTPRGSDDNHQIDADHQQISPEEQRRRDKQKRLQAQREEQARRKREEMRRRKQLAERSKREEQRRRAAAKARALKAQIEAKPQDRPGLLARASEIMATTIRNRVVGWVKDRLGGLFGRSKEADKRAQSQELVARQQREEQRRRELARQARDREKDREDTGYEIIDLDDPALDKPRGSRGRSKDRDEGGFDRTREDDDDRW